MDPLDIGRHWRRLEDLAHYLSPHTVGTHPPRAPWLPFQVDADGDVHAPAGPGLGADIDWDLINSAVTAVAT